MKKPSSKTKRPAPTGSQFWVIDTDTPGISEGQFCASGPYPTQAAAEAAIVADTKQLWQGGCSCTQTDKTIPWCKPLHIVQVRRTVMPEITAKVDLVDTANAPAMAREPLPPKS